MRNETEQLRDRIANLIEGLDDQQMIDDGAVASPNEIAQAIIDDLHLEAYDFTRHDGHTTTHVHGWMEGQ